MRHAEPQKRSIQDVVRSLGHDVLPALLAALVWALEITFRFGGRVGGVLAFIGALGCTSLTLGAVAIVARRQPGQGRPFFPLVLGSLLTCGPIAWLAATLHAKTHHRPLGGVTFAILSGALVAVGTLAIRRVRGLPPLDRRAEVGVWLGLATLTISSVGFAAGPLAAEFDAVHTQAGRWLAEDLVMGVGLAAAVAACPRLNLSLRSARASASAWVVAVLAGAWALTVSMPLRAMFAESAPVAAGVLHALAAPRLL